MVLLHGRRDSPKVRLALHVMETTPNGWVSPEPISLTLTELKRVGIVVYSPLLEKGVAGIDLPLEIA